MAIEANGRNLEITETGNLANSEEWTEEAAAQLAAKEGVVLTEWHRDVLNYLRDEFFNNNGNQTNNRSIFKDMSAKWGRKVTNKKYSTCFPAIPANRPA